MYLSSVKISGFKSFAGTVNISFNSRLTGIVGPNGCGKTNIVDAVRWALGEQKSSVLRSEKMESVIFNGSEKRKPVGMTEVSLTIQNDKKILPSEYTEVTLTRRLYRDGESEYLLNHTPCRLKDINNLFSDTGMGSDAYSVIELKMIEQILSDNGQDRRKLFEEAAGINRYKQRRKQTTKKLEATLQDISRVEDILSEVEKKVAMLELQAEKAKQAAEAKNKLATLELRAAHHELNNAFYTLKDTKSKREKIENEKKDLESIISDLEFELLEKREVLDSLEHDLSDIQTQEATLVASLNQLEKQAITDGQRKTQLKEKNEVNRKEIENLWQTCHFLSEIIEKSNQQITTTEKALDAAQQDHKKNLQALSEKDLILKQQKDALEDLRENHLSLSKEMTSSNALIISLRSQIEAGKKKINLLEENQKKNASVLQVKQKAFLQITETLLHLKKDRDHIQEKLSDAIQQNKNLDKKLSDSKEKKMLLSSSISATEDKLIFLNSLLESYEGLEGIKFLQTSKAKTSYGLGCLGDLISTDENYQSIVRTVFKETQNYYVVETDDEAYLAINALKEHQKGRVPFIVIDKVKSFLSQSEARSNNWVKSFFQFLPGFDQVKTPSSELQTVASIVRCEKNLRDVVNALAGKTYIVSSLEEAKMLSKKIPHAEFITQKGEWYNNRGMLYGGDSGKEKKSPSGRIGRKEELEKQTKKLHNFKNDINDVERVIMNLEEEKANLNEGNLKQELDQINNNISQTEKKEIYEKTEIENFSSQIQRELEQQEQALKELADLKQSLQNTEEKKTLVSEKVNDSKTALNTFLNKVSLLEKELQEAHNLVSSGHVILKEKEFDLKKLKSDAQHAEKDKHQTLSKIEELENDIKSSDKEIESLNTKLEDLSEKTQLLKDQKSELEASIKEKKESYTSLKSTTTAADNNHKERYRRKEVVSQMISEFQQIEFEQAHKMDSIRKHMKEAYNIDVSESATHSKPSENTQEKVLTDPIVLVEEIEKLKKLLKRIGPINELAFEEYQEEKERLNFLTNQRNDLIKAEDQLQSTIGEVNKVATEKFLSTFNTARENFISLFRELFNEGDEADLILETPEYPLESNIDIIAKPKGKRPQSVTLLSGGEKTLTATALLFAIYLIAPSPFCILDEVDAPLDDANVDRFLRIIDKFSDKTQFIIVTHNKRTMEAARVLYGVTMEEQGISKLVAVKFKETQNTI